MTDELERARRVKRDHEAGWMALDGVVAVGIGRAGDRPCVVVSVRGDSPALRARIPERVDGVPVQVRVSGDLRAQ